MSTRKKFGPHLQDPKLQRRVLAILATMEAREMSRAQLARKLGLAPSTVTRRLSGQIGMKDTDWRNIAMELNLSLKKLDLLAERVGESPLHSQPITVAFMQVPLAQELLGRSGLIGILTTEPAEVILNNTDWAEVYTLDIQVREQALYLIGPPAQDTSPLRHVLTQLQQIAEEL